MPDVRVELARTPEEFRAKLMKLGVAAATHGTLVEGLDKNPDENAGFVFSYQGRTRGAGFHTNTVPMTKARAVIARVTTLQAGQSRRIGVRTVTEYTLS